MKRKGRLNKGLAMFLTVLMLLSLFPTGALAVGAGENEPETGYIDGGLNLAGDGGGGDCVCADGCTEDAYNADCPVCAADYSQCASWVPDFDLPETDTSDVSLMAAGIAPGGNVSGEGDWSNVLGSENVRVNSGTITLTQNVTLSSPIVINAGTYSLTSDVGGPFTITADSAGGSFAPTGDYMLTVKAGTLNLTGIKVDGSNRVGCLQAGDIANGTIKAFATIGAGVTLTKGIGTGAANGGGGVRVHEGGQVTMSDGLITGNNNTQDAGGVDIHAGDGQTNTLAKFIMTGGEISGNSSVNNGGGVLVNVGTFTMTGGAIINNQSGSSSGNGGVAILNNGSFEIGSGSTITITGNTNNGNAENVYLGSTQEIKVNSAPTAGSKIGVYKDANPTAGSPVAITDSAGGQTAEFWRGVFTSDKPTNAGITIGTGVTANKVVLDYDSRPAVLGTIFDAGTTTDRKTALGASMAATAVPNEYLISFASLPQNTQILSSSVSSSAGTASVTGSGTTITVSGVAAGATVNITGLKLTLTGAVTLKTQPMWGSSADVGVF